jgi:hypothetical protein
MKTTIPQSLSSVYSIRVGSDDCRVRGIEVEPIEAIFAEPSTDRQTACQHATPWADVTGPDEIVTERMVVPPAVRKRSRLVASRAILLRGCD